MFEEEKIKKEQEGKLMKLERRVQLDLECLFAKGESTFAGITPRAISYFNMVYGAELEKLNQEFARFLREALQRFLYRGMCGQVAD